MSQKEIIKLNLFGLPVIQSIDDFSAIVHISKYSIYQLSANSNKYYTTYNIPKKSGGSRLICQPSKNLKGLQSWILVNLLNKVKVSPSCKGFRKGSSILDNALPHKGSNTILNLDLKDFFPSITHKQVYNIFKTIGYNKLMSTVFSNICTYNDSLPQGGPCSPTLANLATWQLDLRIQGFVGKRGISYTRYADDLTFSGLNPQKISKIIPTIKSIITNENFQVNNKKTRLLSSARRKVVTGLVINDESVGVGKMKYKELRSKIHHLTMTNEQSNLKLLQNVNGWLAYLNSVDVQRFRKIMFYINKLKQECPDTLISKL
jgi:RNA-directed DNA polymerase